MDRETVEAVRVPDVTGLPFETAKQTIADAGLNFSLQPDFPGPGAEATATSTFPIAGELAIVGSTVLLFWADPAVEVPPPPDPAVPGGLVGERRRQYRLPGRIQPGCVQTLRSARRRRHCRIRHAGRGNAAVPRFDGQSVCLSRRR